MEYPIRLLGELESSVDGEGGAGLSATQRAVVALLAVHANRHMHTARVLDRLGWPDDAQHRRRLGRGLVAISALFADGPMRLERTADGSLLMLRAGPDDVDLLAVREEVRRARRATEREDHAAALTDLYAAVGRWRGTAMLDLDVCRDWPERAQLDEEYAMLVEDLAAAEIALGFVSPWVVEQLAQRSRADPLRENCHVLLLRALVLSGRHEDAHVHHDSVVALLAEKYGATPGPALLREGERLRSPSGTDDEVAVLSVSRLGRDIEPDDEEIECLVRRHGGLVVWRVFLAVLSVFSGPGLHERALAAATALRDSRVARGIEPTAFRISVASGPVEVFAPQNARALGSIGTVLAGEALTESRTLFFGPPNGRIVVNESTYRATRATVGYEPCEGGYAVLT